MSRRDRQMHLRRKVMHANAQIHKSFAKVSVPVTYSGSGEHICFIDIDDNELCMIAKAIVQISEAREVLEKWKSVTGFGPSEVLEKCWVLINKQPIVACGVFVLDGWPCAKT